MVPIASLLGTQHQGLVWGEVLATYWRHVQGVYLYIKLPHATETGDRLLPYGPNGSRTIGGDGTQKAHFMSWLIVSNAFFKSMNTPAAYFLESIAFVMSSIASVIANVVDLFDLKPYRFSASITLLYFTLLYFTLLNYCDGTVHIDGHAQGI